MKTFGNVFLKEKKMGTNKKGKKKKIAKLKQTNNSTDKI